jgi:hypothetical protein
VVQGKLTKAKKGYITNPNFSRSVSAVNSPLPTQRRGGSILDSGEVRIYHLPAGSFPRAQSDFGRAARRFMTTNRLPGASLREVDTFVVCVDPRTFAHLCPSDLQHLAS